MRDLAIGIDIGTTSVKSIVVSATGEIVWERSISHDLVSLRPGFAEEDASVWWASTQSLLRDIAATIPANRITALAFSGMVPTLVLVGRDGSPLRMSIQQNDARAVAEIRSWKSRIDEDAYFVRTGNTVNQQVIFPTIDWLRLHEPDILAKTVNIMGSYNYMSFRATGVRSLDTKWALESGVWQIEKRQWDREILTKAGIDASLLPPVHEAGDVVGTTTEELRRETGFPAGIPVIAGVAAHGASALATGVRDPGGLRLKLGGAGDVLFASDSLRLDRRLFIDYHPVSGYYLLNGCMAASGSIVKWLMNLLELSDFDALTVEASKLPPGSDRLLLLPYFLGEKTPIFDTEARGVFFGLTLSHGRAHLFRAVLEAVAFGFMHHVQVLEHMGLDIGRVFLSNGGARSPLWKSIVLDVVGRNGMYVPNHPGSCLGAALVALESLGVSSDWSALAGFLKGAVTIEYSPENHQRYRPFFDLYRELYEQSKGLFVKLQSLPQGDSYGETGR